MLTYNNQRLRKAAVGYAGSAAVTGVVFGSVTLMLWTDYFAAPRDLAITIWSLILITMIIVIMLGVFIFGASVICSEVQVHSDGLLIKTDLWRWCLIPWKNITDAISWSHSSRLNPKGDTTFVMIREGLSFWHYSPVRTAQGQVRWALGFVIMASGQNYNELSQYIREYLATAGETYL